MRYQLKDDLHLAKQVNLMSVRQLIKQVICPAFSQDTDPFDPEIGAVFFHPNQAQILKQRIEHINRCRTQPVLLVSDMECSPGDAIHGASKLPSMLALGQIDDEGLAFQAGCNTAIEGFSYGFRWTLAPVSDILGSDQCPIVGLRSAGHTPERVIRIAGAYMSGIQSQGMAATIKHFPGDGYGLYDQHLTTPENPLKRDEWWELSGKVFQSLIDQGAMAVMPGHISLPWADVYDEKMGGYPPASLSKRILHDLLRGELGFDGIIVSDAVSMGGMVGYRNYYRACADFLECGGDCLLFAKPTPRFYEVMEQMVREGILKLDTLRNRAYRMMCFSKEQNQKKEPAKMPNEGLPSEVAARCITLVRDRQRVLPYPIHRDTKVLYVVILNDRPRHAKLVEQMIAEIKAYTDHITVLDDPGSRVLFEEVDSGKYDLALCSVGNLQSYGTNVLRLHGPVARNMMDGWMKLGTPVIFLSHFDPFIHREYQFAADTVINTYGFTDDTAKALLERIVGQTPICRELRAHQ